MRPPTDWKTLILSGSSIAFGAEASYALGVPVPSKKFLKYCQKFVHEKTGQRPNPEASDWSESSWWTFLKTKAIEIGIYDIHEPPKEMPSLACKMNIGFLFIEETEEELANLRREKGPVLISRVARSRISKAIVAISPIDRVAARVAPDKEPP